ncbi:MAG TPA: DUF493 family protein [Rhodanobacteraceae bacterium]
MTTKAGKGDGERGFQFPGRFEITAVGDATADLRARVPQLLESAGVTVLHETVSHRHSSGGKYISVTVSFECPTREAYEAAHRVLRAEAAVHYTL